MSKLTENEAALIAKALGDPTRFSIYQQIARGKEIYCGEICAKHSVSAGTVSHHLKVLSDLKLISSRKEGLNVYYQTAPERFTQYIEYLTQLRR